MITGSVTSADEAVIRVEVQGPNQQRTSVNAVIDTGFTEFLSLPPWVVQGLGLPFRGSVVVVLGDGSMTNLAVYGADVEWDGQWRAVSVHEADGSPLVGMSLLRGYELRVQVVDGGSVTIEALP